MWFAAFIVGMAVGWVVRGLWERPNKDSRDVRIQQLTEELAWATKQRSEFPLGGIPRPLPGSKAPPLDDRGLGLKEKE